MSSFVKRCLFLVALILVPGGSAQEKTAGGPGQPRTPSAAQKLFRLPADLRIELVAAEPVVQSPVALTFDPQGRLWVVEMHDYPNGPPPGQPPQGRLRILEDKDGDGYYEHASTFADKLLFANGLMLWRDGAIVTAAPHIVHLRDTDRDGVADKREVLYEGFAAQNPQLRVSHPNLGLDGWVYVANGLRGGSVKRAGRDEAPVNLSGMDFRFDLLRDKGEAISGLGQFGNTFDAWGRRFVCDNRHHLRHVVLEDRYVKRNPYLAAPSLVEDISELEDGPLSSGGKVYPLSRNWTTSNLHEGRFTAACGVFIYESELLGKTYRGGAFTCDPTGNLVHMEVLTPKGATFSARPLQKGVEFLATPDDWFRPVFLTSGPDGALYIADMYRAVIEHPDFMPPELKNRPDLLLGKEKGRIWRVVPAGHKTTPVRPTLGTDPASLVAALAHELPWYRTSAQRLLLQDLHSSMQQPLMKLLSASDPLARIHASYLIDRFGPARLIKLLGDPHPRVREHAIVLAERHLADRPELGAWLLKMADDPDLRVRYQLALTLGELDGPEVLSALARIARAGSEDRWTRLAIASAVPRRAGALFTKVLADEPAAKTLLLLQELATLVGARQDPAEFQQLVSTLQGLKGADGERLQLVGLNGLADGLTRRGGRLGPALHKLAPGSDAWFDSVLGGFAPRIHDAKLLLDQRLSMIRLFGHGSWAGARQTLLPLLGDEPAQEVRLAAVRALAAHGDKDTPALLMRSWRAAAPAVRKEILEAMLRQPERTRFLLAEVQAKRIGAGEIDALRTRQLLKHADPGIRAQAASLLQDNLPKDRQVALAEYRAALKLDGDAKLGREVFRKHCATCHKVGGVGVDVGPDISDTRTKTLDALLTDVILPNQAIDNNFVNYLVSTKSGRTYTGLLAAETASSITLRRAEGQSDVVLRQDVDDIASTGVSLMPDGLEKNIPVGDMAHLLSFLKNWRYLDGSVPVGGTR